MTFAFRWTRNLLAVMGLLFVTVTASPVVVYRWATWLAGPWQDPTGDILIVLGGSVLEDGTIGESSYWRAVYAARAFHEGRFRQIVVAGGGSPSVAESMRHFLICYGIPPEAMLLEEQSRSTHENATQVAGLLSGVPGEKVLLTSDFHMFRAYRAFSKAGLEVLPRPFPDVRKRAGHWASRWPAFLILATETLKIAYYQARGWI